MNKLLALFAFKKSIFNLTAVRPEPVEGHGSTSSPRADSTGSPRADMPRWSIIGDALIRAESEISHAAKIVNTELLVADDELSHSQMSGMVSALCRIKKQLQDLRGMAVIERGVL